MRGRILIAAVLLAPPLGAAAEGEGPTPFQAVCIAAVPELDAEAIRSAARDYTGREGARAFDYEFEAGRACQVRAHGAPAPTREGADADADAIAEAAGGEVVVSRAEDGGRGFFHRIDAPEGEMIVVTRLEGPVRFSMVRDTSHGEEGGRWGEHSHGGGHGEGRRD
ncbi:hypothetical protein BCF33_1546 [Hasllibacter halocynthiae]|uniref:YpeB-like protein with protease inhibitory function n=1 Tax=Hasllibacter halocynthiae TaxID=595589 RepID=A0A2T0X161_9RHOB|nr:hypothetical protein [Hasllibacter halocynthiae]PRY92693.1 hypothetical protein BCF33_1546 [Hasllibacter halocynthiae]